LSLRANAHVDNGIREIPQISVKRGGCVPGHVFAPPQ
jgi:hypothetical protein